MSTVVARFEPCRKDTGRGTVYYRIYKGHNRRMEFSSRLRLPVSFWDETMKTVKGDREITLKLVASVPKSKRISNF